MLLGHKGVGGLVWKDLGSEVSLSQWPLADPARAFLWVP